MIFSSNFFPCIDYFRNLNDQDIIRINTAEQYRKQSYKTRAYILGPQKIETISVPVQKVHNNELIKNVRVDYSENWNQKSWKAIRNSYSNSPYFEYFEDYLVRIFEKKYDFLVDLNLESLTICLKILRLNKTICQEDFSYYEYKNQFISFNAKNRLENATISPFKPYSQIFGNKFEPNLSILDLLFSRGPQSLGILNPENQLENN